MFERKLPRTTVQVLNLLRLRPVCVVLRERSDDDETHHRAPHAVYINPGRLWWGPVEEHAHAHTRLWYLCLHFYMIYWALTDNDGFCLHRRPVLWRRHIFSRAAPVVHVSLLRQDGLHGDVPTGARHLRTCRNFHRGGECTARWNEAATRERERCRTSYHHHVWCGSRQAAWVTVIRKKRGDDLFVYLIISWTRLAFSDPKTNCCVSLSYFQWDPLWCRSRW